MKTLWNRRQVISSAGLLGLGASATGLSYSQSPALRPRRAVFVYVHGGDLQNTWGAPCGTNVVTRSLAPVGHRCTIFKSVDHLSSGFSVGTRFALADSSFDESNNSLDTRLANTIGRGTAIPHLRLIAGAAQAEDVTPTVVGGRALRPEEYQSDPLLAFESLQLNSNFKPFTTRVETNASRFDIDSGRHMDLTALALQSGVTNVATIMLGGADGWIEPPERLGFAEGTSWRAQPISGSPESAIPIKAYLTEKLAYLIKRLASTYDESGYPLLDSTVVFQCTNMGEPVNYTSRGGCYMLAGADQFFQHGRVVDIELNHVQLLNAIASVFNISPQNELGGFPEGVLG